MTLKIDGGYYMEAVERLVVSDWGRENVGVRDFQHFLHCNIHDSSATDHSIGG